MSNGEEPASNGEEARDPTEPDAGAAEQAPDNDRETDADAAEQAPESSAKPAHPGAPPAHMPHISLALISLIHAAVFGWAAYMLPWDDWTAFALLAAAVALLHLATALLALLRHPKLALVWRIQAAGSTLLLGYAGWGLFSSAWYVSHVYSGLGQGLGAALLAVFGLLVMMTAPLALWGFLATGGIRLGRVGGGALLVVLALTGLRLWMLQQHAQGETLVSGAHLEQVETLLSELPHKPTRHTGKRSSLMTPKPAPCVLDPAKLTLVVTSQHPVRGKPAKLRRETRCLQADTPAALADALDAIVQQARGPLKLDLLRTRYALPEQGWLASLVFRPGLDGACTEQGCLMPWQLSAMDMFTTHQLIPSVPDARMGVSLQALRAKLGAKDKTAPLSRIGTKSWLLQRDGTLLAAGRSPRQQVELTPEEIRRTEQLARSHIFSAQARDGRFRYMTQPHTGVAHNGGFSVPRQAGTTLVVCELGGDNAFTKRVAQRSLQMLASLEQPLGSSGEGERAVLVHPKGAKPEQVGIGASALSLAALLRCRPLVGDRFDALIGRLARMVMSQQRPDGSFHHRIDPRDGNPVEALGSLYVDGQAVLGLTLLEDIAEDEAGAFPARAKLHDAVERAMVFYGSEYWQIPLRPFLFLEENWHCIAAAASLYHHRNDAYERFCLDYVRFKSRIVLEPDEGVHADFIGGYAFGNIVPPHNTATAGFGEALAAAMKIKRARKEPLDEDITRMRLVLQFMLRNQWRRESCYACSPKIPILGGFSEHMASPNIRIDYVQHAWAAIGHGARAAGLLDAPGDAS